jgi:hypothetical protein
MMERDYIIGLFTLTGVVVTQFLNFIAGRYAANRAGLSGVTIANVGAQSKLIDSLVVRLNQSEEREEEWRARWQQMHDALNDARAKYEPLARESLDKDRRIDALERRVTDCEERWARQAAAEPGKRPRRRK